MAARRTYDAELDDLEAAYAAVRVWDGIGELQRALMSVAGGPALFIGTGGTLAVARLAAQLHERVGGQPARVATPLELLTLGPMTRTGVVLFSAGLKHPDALAAVERLGSSRLRPAVVLTLRDRESIESLLPPEVEPVCLPPLEYREGFLATASVLSMMTALARAYGYDADMPNALQRPDVAYPEHRRRLLLLTTPGLLPVAVDLETRMHELGLADVQLTDFRNFAHGRHVGLARHQDETSVLGLIDRPLRHLARATLDVLPTDTAHVTAWETEQDGPAGVVELLVASMQLTALAAKAQGVNVARPGAAPFGRKLYHLRLRRLLPPNVDGPVERKLLALVASSNDGEARERYDLAFAEWHKALEAAEFGGVVLDYDGTTCSTGDRAAPPSDAVQTELLRLLDRGMILGFASGRGGSLHRELRRWTPKTHWPQVHLGLYNGGALLTLADELDDYSTPSALMEQVVNRLAGLPVADALAIEARTGQVTVTVHHGSYAQFGRLGALISDAMSRDQPLAVKVGASGHSIDIIDATTSKISVAEVIEQRTGRHVLAVGDQGDVGGNDFELLARSPWTLSVDRCSADPSRCWYLDPSGRSGPDLLVRYLQAIRPTNRPGLFSWSAK